MTKSGTTQCGSAQSVEVALRASFTKLRTVCGASAPKNSTMSPSLVCSTARARAARSGSRARTWQRPWRRAPRRFLTLSERLASELRERSGDRLPRIGSASAARRRARREQRHGGSVAPPPSAPARGGVQGTVSPTPRAASGSSCSGHGMVAPVQRASRMYRPRSCARAARRSAVRRVQYVGRQFGGTPGRLASSGDARRVDQTVSASTARQSSGNCGAEPRTSSAARRNGAARGRRLAVLDALDSAVTRCGVRRGPTACRPVGTRWRPSR